MFTLSNVHHMPHITKSLLSIQQFSCDNHVYFEFHSPKCMFTLSNALHMPHITKLLLSVQQFCCDNHVYFEFHSPKCMFTLSNVLHVPHITKPLLSVQQFCRDNHVYFEFHDSMFYVKDLITKEVLLSGQGHDGLYVLFESSTTSVPQDFWSLSISTTADLWHNRLGHPTPRIFNLLVSGNKIVCTSRRSLTHCQACPLGKSFHLSLRPTGHKTSAPLDLIFSDVLGPAPMFSSDGFHYFVIFVDAPNTYGIICLLRNLMSFPLFNIFKHLLSVRFHLKLNTFKMIGAVNIVN